MAPRRNPLGLNPLQLRTLTLLQQLAQSPDYSQPGEDSGTIVLTRLPQPHGDHFHLGRAVVATRDAINRLIEEQIKQRMVASVAQDYAFRIVGRALPPDEDDRYSPRRLRLAIAGLVLGLLAGALAAIWAAMSAGGLRAAAARTAGT